MTSNGSTAHKDELPRLVMLYTGFHTSLFGEWNVSHGTPLGVDT